MLYFLCRTSWCRKTFFFPGDSRIQSTQRLRGERTRKTGKHGAAKAFEPSANSPANLCPRGRNRPVVRIARGGREKSPAKKRCPCRSHALECPHKPVVLTPQSKSPGHPARPPHSSRPLSSLLTPLRNMIYCLLLQYTLYPPVVVVNT